MRAVPAPPRDAVAKVYWEHMSDPERAERIAEALDHAGITQPELAERLGMSLSTVGRWKTGKTHVPWGRWVAICSVLGISATRRVLPDWFPSGP